jgi:hypothetical protein
VPAQSSAAKTFGLVSIVLGSVYGVWSGVAILQAAMMLRMRTPSFASGEAEVQATLERTRALMETSARVEIAQSSVMLVMNVVLVVAGVLLLEGSETGRRVLCGWSVAALFVLVGRAIGFELVIFPMMTSALAAASRGLMDDQAGRMGAFMRLSTYGTLLVMAVFPVTTFFTMRSRTIRAALAATQALAS